MFFGSYTELTLKPKKAKLISSTFEIGHFRVPPGLCIKTRLSAQPLIRKCYSILMQIKTHFHNNGCALGLILKVRVFGTRTWPITYLHIRQSSQCAKECHGLAAAWWAAKNHGLMFSQPRVQECFMSHCVYCWNDNIRCCDFVSLHFNLRHLGLP